MKKHFAFALSMALMLSLTACGNQTNNAESSTSGVESSAASVSTEQPDLTTEDPAPEPSFDNSWASNEFEQQLPQLPFTEYTSKASERESNAWYISVQNALYTDVKAYAEQLMQCAFTQNNWISDESDGIDYRFSADSETGFSITYDFNAYSYDDPITGILSIAVFDNRIARELTDGVSWGDKALDTVFPALPDGNWEGNISDSEWSKTSALSCDTLRVEDLEAYAQKLRDAGFTEETDDGTDYRFYFRGRKTNNRLSIIIQAEDLGNGTLSTEIFAVFNKQ